MIRFTLLPNQDRALSEMTRNYFSMCFTIDCSSCIVKSKNSGLMLPKSTADGDKWY